MGRAAVLERVCEMGAPLRPFLADGRPEALADPAICGKGDAVGV
jgi:hypothetical protein